MPKINVYLPDPLAAAVREAEIPVSAVCQAALADAVQKVQQVRWTTGALRDRATPADTFDRLEEGLGQRMTARLVTALDAAATDADGAPRAVITSGDLLRGLLAAENLATRLLVVERVDLDSLGGTADPVEEDGPTVDTGRTRLGRMTMPARAACAAALDVVVEQGHNYVGCEHLLVGLAGTPGAAHDLLAAHGVRRDAVHRALGLAIAGVAHERAGAAQRESATVAELTRRLEAVERKLADQAG